MNCKNPLPLIAVCATLLTGCGINETAESIAVSTEQSSELNNTVSVPSSSKDIAFKIVDADYNQYDETFGAEEQQRIKSSVIQNLDQLNCNTILPSINYPADFFNENALIFISVVFTNTAGEVPVIKRVYYDYESNEIQINAERGPAYAESIEWWCCFIEIPKSDIVDADQATMVNVNVDGKLPNIE